MHGGIFTGNMGTRFPKNPWTHRKYLQIVLKHPNFVRYSGILGEMSKKLCPFWPIFSRNLPKRYLNDNIIRGDHPGMCALLYSPTWPPCYGAPTLVSLSAVATHTVTALVLVMSSPEIPRRWWCDRKYSSFFLHQDTKSITCILLNIGQVGDFLWHHVSKIAHLEHVF